MGESSGNVRSPGERRLRDLKNNIKKKYVHYLEDILLKCASQYPLSFNDIFGNEKVKHIGSGKFCQCLRIPDKSAFKIQRVGRQPGHFDRYLRLIRTEIDIYQTLQSLTSMDRYHCTTFADLLNCWLVWDYPLPILKYPHSEANMKLLFVVYEMEYGGTPISFLKTPWALSCAAQICLALATAEKALEFEHRDLHSGNVLIKETPDEYIRFVIDGVPYNIKSHGLKVTIIDFCFSRLKTNGLVHYYPLKRNGTPLDNIIGGDWKLFFPRTNIMYISEIFEIIFESQLPFFINMEDPNFSQVENCDQLARLLLSYYFWRRELL